MARSDAPTTKHVGSSAQPEERGLRIGDAAAAKRVSTRTLRYYEELGLIQPSEYTTGGERRYTPDDLAQLDRILELREVLGMNLEDIKGVLSMEARLDELRTAYRASKDADTSATVDDQRVALREALVLRETLVEQLNAKLARMEAFRAKLLGDAQRCKELLAELD